MFYLSNPENPPPPPLHDVTRCASNADWSEDGKRPSFHDNVLSCDPRDKEHAVAKRRRFRILTHYVVFENSAVAYRYGVLLSAVVCSFQRRPFKVKGSFIRRVDVKKKLC